MRIINIRCIDVVICLVVRRSRGRSSNEPSKLAEIFAWRTYAATLRAVAGRDMALGAVVKAAAEVRAIKARKSFMVVWLDLRKANPKK